MLPRKFLLLVCALLSLSPGWAAAQETSPDATPAQVEDGEPPGEEAPTSPVISFHGYLSQAYAASDGLQIVGITKDGTADYRSAAVQIRADLSDQDAFIVQLSHERLGASPINAFRQDVEVDWLFYEHQFGDSAVKVGRVQIPFGIYNEVRDVGVLLPFFRPSLDFYGEGSFNSETVDGIVLSHSFKPWGSWSLAGDLYYGNFDFVSVDTEYFLSKASDTYGFELWLETPVPGLRLGAGGMRFQVRDTRKPADRALPWTVYHLSLEGQFGRFSTHAEYANFDAQPWPGARGRWETGYAHLGYALTDKITLNGQVEIVDFLIQGVFDGEFDDDKALGVNYAFQPNLVLKAEHHWNQGYHAENPLASLFGAPLDTRYWILSLSTSF
jgi:hypothetical protein